MSFEETLVCDICSRVIDGGPRHSTLTTLRDKGGRAFKWDPLGHRWQERFAEEPWVGTQRHLCGRCVNVNATEFYDGKPVPMAQETNR